MIVIGHHLNVELKSKMAMVLISIGIFTRERKMKGIALFTVLASVIAVSGCAGFNATDSESGSEVAVVDAPTIDLPETQVYVQDSEGKLIPIEEANQTGLVKVFFGTNRGLKRDDSCTGSFGVTRSKLSYGYCNISIPQDHRVGNVESPSWFKFEFTDDPKKHVSILGGRVIPKAEFDQLISSSLSKTGMSFVYIHGYNVTFEDAAKRTAQIAYDLKFRGAPVFFSWPSKGRFRAYPADEATAEWSKTSLFKFLEDYLGRSDVKGVYLIAHSMGNRAVTGAITELYTRRPDLKDKVKEIILAAPDIDSGVFEDEVAPKLAQGARPVTLYASSKDLALIASKTFHEWPRAGYITDNVMVSPGIETIDASLIKTDFLGHSYYGDSDSIISDIRIIFDQGARAGQREKLTPVSGTSGGYWRFEPGKK